MNTLSNIADAARQTMIEQEAQAAREKSAENYLKRLKEFNVTSITELNEAQREEFVNSLRSLEG